MKEFFMLVDCDNFYVSCERAFNPKLRNRPIGVLSNNDGCIVARSNELKLLGIPMGAPVFKYKRELIRNSVILFSSNYALYGDISSRIVSILKRFTPDLEVYSIDESFLKFYNMDIPAVKRTALNIRETVYRWTGIPVSIGISSTKTLAKLASKIAKKKKGVFLIDPDNDNTEIFNKIQISELWGIGKKYNDLLIKKGILNVQDLISQSNDFIKKHLKITGLRMVKELKGISCLDLVKDRILSKSIIHSSSFSDPVFSEDEIRRAVAYHAERSAEKLRNMKGLASFITVYISTGRFSHEKYYNSYTLGFDEPVNFSDEIIKYAQKALSRIFITGKAYKKSGICLSGIVNESACQLNLFRKALDIDKKKRLFRVYDNINRRYGKSSVTIARALNTKKGKKERISKRYTTVWDELLLVNAD